MVEMAKSSRTLSEGVLVEVFTAALLNIQVF
jgi:hypothetical protein